MSGGGKTQTSTQQVSIPPEVLARYNSINARAEGVADTPFQQYGGQFVAPVNVQQQRGIAGINNAANSAQPYFGAATGLTAAGAGAVNPGELQTQRYMNPYTENVVNATRRGLEQQQGQQASQQQADAIRGGAFGGDRAGIQRAVLQGQQGLATAQAIAPLYQQGYSQALQTGQQQQGVNLAADQANAARYLQAGQQFAGLGAQQQQSQLAGAQAQIGAGTLQQQTEQADTAARYQQFLQERGYPFQVAQFLANIGMGTGALSGSTTTTTQPGSFFSDEREKTNIKPLGEGQYAYDYIDDVERAERTGSPMPPKRVGPMAQDIERSDPGQIIDVNGYKVVNPTGESYSGGLAGGGYVDEPGAYDRGGYAPGGLVDPVDIRAILASQQQFLGPYAGQGGPYGGQKQGQPGFVPQASLPVPKLATAGNLSQPRSSEFAQLTGGLQQVQGLGESLLGDKGLLGKDGLGSKAMKRLGKVRDIASPPPAGSTGPMTINQSGAASAGPRVINQSGAVGAGLGAPRESADAAAGLSSAPVRVSYLEEATPTLASRGGLMPHGYAMGGMPYGGDPTLQGVLDEGDQQIRQLPKPGQAPGAARGLGSDLMDAAKLGTSLYSMGSTAATAAAAAPEALAALMAFLPFSDQRLKHNIDPVGETYDGQHIYRYDMGDGRTQLGLMAQEVAQLKPDAVGSRNGFLTLDYDRATEDAVPRAYGGLVPRLGYQQGGYPDMPADDELAVRTMLSEAGRGRRGEVNPQEALGIAAVIANRAKARGLSPGDVVLEQGQFEPWAKPGGSNDPMKWDTSSPAYQQMAEYWARAKAGEDPTGGASHFWGPGSQFALGRSAPKWSGTGAPRLGATQFEYVDSIPGGRDIPTVRAPGLAAEGAQEAQAQRSGQGMYVPGGQQQAPAEGGLGAAMKAVFPTTKSPTGEESVNWKQTLIPVLTGLGAMASSPSRYLGSAILQGVGAGAQSYANLEKQQADIGQTQELTRTQQAETVRVWLANAKDAMFTAQGRQYILTAKGPVLWTVYAADPTKYGEPLAGPQARRAIEAYPGATPITPDVYGEGQRETPTTGEPPAPGEKPGKKQVPQHVSTPNPQYVTGGPTPYTLIGTTAPRNIELDVFRSKYGTKEEIEANRTETQQNYANYRSMSENSSKLADQFDRLAQYALSLPKEGWAEQGPLNNLKTLWTGYANEVLRTAGAPVRISEADIGTGEAIRKLQSALSGQAGSRSDQALSTAMSSIPNISQSRDGFIKSYVPERVRMQKDMDTARYIEDYRREYEKKYGKSFPSGWSIVNAERGFKDDNPENNYVEDEKRMKWLMNTPDPRTGQDYWSSFRSNKYPQYFVDRLTRGIGYRRYFEGFRQ